MEMEPDRKARDRDQEEEEVRDGEAVGDVAEWAEIVRVPDQRAHVFVPVAGLKCPIRWALPAILSCVRNAVRRW